MSGFIPETGEYLTPAGVKLKLTPVSFIVLQNFRIRLAKTRPEIPQVRVDYGDGNYGFEPAPNDPTYQTQLALWEEESSEATMRLIFNLGVANDPPKKPDAILAYEAYLHATNLNGEKFDSQETKYLWVGSLLGGEEGIGDLMKYIVGQNQATQEGLAEAAESFRGAGESE